MASRFSKALGVVAAVAALSIPTRGEAQIYEPSGRADSGDLLFAATVGCMGTVAGNEFVTENKPTSMIFGMASGALYGVINGLFQNNSEVVPNNIVAGIFAGSAGGAACYSMLQPSNRPAGVQPRREDNSPELFVSTYNLDRRDFQALGFDRENRYNAGLRIKF